LNVVSCAVAENKNKMRLSFKNNFKHNTKQLRWEFYLETD
jgi:hypothetical protein